MYLVKILNADHRPVDVEVSLEIKAAERKRKQRQRCHALEPFKPA